jgi:hypothetical protein
VKIALSAVALPRKHAANSCSHPCHSYDSELAGRSSVRVCLSESRTMDARYCLEVVVAMVRCRMLMCAMDMHARLYDRVHRQAPALATAQQKKRTHGDRLDT